MYSAQELHPPLLLCLAKAILAIFTSSTFSVHSSISLSANFFPHLQFSESKYSPTSQNLSHSHSQLLGFQIYPLSPTPLSYYSLHSHLHSSSFQPCLLLQILALSLHLHLLVSGHSMQFVSLVFDIRLNTLTFRFLTISGTHIFTYRLLILLKLPLHLLTLLLKGKIQVLRYYNQQFLVLLCILDCSLKFNSTNLRPLQSIKMLILY